LTASSAVSSSRAISSSFAISSSYLNGDTPTYLFTQKTSTQTLTNNATTVITGWGAPIQESNSLEWNATTGVFTATKTGWYDVYFAAQLGSDNYGAVGGEVSVSILVNGSITSFGRWFVPVLNYTTLPPMIMCQAIVRATPGLTISTAVFNATGGNRALFGNGTFVKIIELPGRLTR
jgi:hypothetical protein